MAEALYLNEACAHKISAGGAISSGEIQRLSDKRAAFLEGLQAVASGDAASLRCEAIVKATCASGVTFSRGDAVFWDATNNTAIAASSAVDGTDFYLGRAHKAKTSGQTVVEVDLNALGEAQCLGQGKVYEAVAASAAVTNTTTETAFDKSYTIPANTLKAGDVIKIRAQVIATATNSTDTLTIKAKAGSTVLAATAAVDVADNDIAVIDIYVVFRTVGASGTMVAFGFVSLGVAGTATARPVSLASTSVDTTAAIALTVTATWSVADAGNSCRLDGLHVERMSDRVVL